MSEQDPVPGFPAPGSSTKGWDARPVLSGTATEGTVTHVAGSTPGPAHAQEATRTEDTERLAPPPDLNDPKLLPDIPGYRVEQRIGRGGMATVYRAVHLDMDRPVALKLINPGGCDPEYVQERFTREIQSLARVEHPNVITIYSSGQWLGFPFLTMRYVPAGPLSANMERYKGDPRAIARLVVKIARGVQALHDAGILHRDLKPHNILLADGDEPLVADFGLAKWMDDANSDLTVTFIPIGTRQYMSPEQTLGLKNYHASCDVWAIGVILYELLAGMRPFAGASSEEVFDRIRTGPPPPLPSEAPEELGAIIRKCLAKKPIDRYQSAAAIADNLEQWLAGTFVPPPPPPPAAVLPPWAYTVAVCALLLLIFLPPAFMPMGKGRTPEPDKLAIPTRSIEERLRAGETVVLVDENGKVMVEYAVLPGSLGLPTTEFRGRLTLNSSGRLAIVLAELPIDIPVVFQGEVAFVQSNTDASWCGMFAGAKETQTPTGVNITSFDVTQRNSFPAVVGGAQILREEGVFELRRAAVAGGSGTTEIDSERIDTPLAADREPELRWREFKIAIIPRRDLWNMPIVPGRIAGSWQDRPLGELTSGYALKTFNFCYQSTSPGGGQVFALPIVGRGMGLSVNNASAVFKDVKLIPLIP